jgi:hypothetical protein
MLTGHAVLTGIKEGKLQTREDYVLGHTTSWPHFPRVGSLGYYACFRPSYSVCNPSEDSTMDRQRACPLGCPPLCLAASWDYVPRSISESHGPIAIARIATTARVHSLRGVKTIPQNFGVGTCTIAARRRRTSVVQTLPIYRP